MTRIRTLNILGITILVALGLSSVTQAQDDTALFSTAVPPNVMLMADNSGSMHHIVWHPDFDPDIQPTDPEFADYDCNHYTANSQYFYSSTTTLTRCGNTATIYVDPAVSGSTRYMGRYLNWLFSTAGQSRLTEIALLNNGNTSACLGGGTFSLYRRSRVTALKQILREVICQVNAAGTVRFGIAQFRRGGDPNGGYVSVPINDYLDAANNPFQYTIEGSFQSHADHLNDAIDNLTGEAWTPLGETMFQVYTYFMSRISGDRPEGYNRDGPDGVPNTGDELALPGLATGIKFPEYVYEPDHPNNGPYSAGGAPGVPDSPVQWACQRNFVIVITDGEPTKDDFDLNSSPANTIFGYSNFRDQLIGDYHVDGQDEEPGSFPGCSSCEAARYLDDIALFMNTNDFRPDLDGDQLLDVYTVGFTTSPFANDVLEDTAQNGNGEFFFSNNAEELSAAIVAAISDIIQKSQAFTAATVPATRTSQGGKFYNSLFIPLKDTGYWEGHLRSWTLNAAGEIRDSLGNCALLDPVPGQCFSGPFNPSAVPWWDAADGVPTPASRNLTTSRINGVGVAQEVAFTTAVLSGADLGLAPGDELIYQYPPTVPVPATPDALGELVVLNARGCKFGTGTVVPCEIRTDSKGDPHMLGDIFHSNPVVVPRPGGFLPEQSYKDWSSQATNAPVATRDRVMVAGANDGFFRIFHAGTWYDPLPATGQPGYDEGTGNELAGFAPYESRTNIKNITLDGGSRDHYFTDGSPSVADVWLPTTPTTTSAGKVKDEWATVVVAGLRQGGREYFALDITDPASSGYPQYMWEFPKENDPAAIKDVMGDTWSEPVITRIRVEVNGDDNSGIGYERWVAVVAGGYAPESDPNNHAAYDPNATQGRSLMMIDIQTGELIALKKFDPAAGPGYNPANPEGDMRYAMPSTPGVYDIDFDGFTDVIYVGDLGGNIWKWVVKPIGHDAVNSASPDTSQPNWHFEKYFAAPIYNDGTNNFHKSFFFNPSATLKSGVLWLAIGSGERANLMYPGDGATDLENNRFYALKDLDPLEKGAPSLVPLDESTLYDITGDSSCVDVGAFDGFYFRGVDGEKFVTNTDIFFFYVFVASYEPSAAATPCDAGGIATLYAFKVYCGEGLFDDGAGNPQASINLGDGMPTDPKISLSDQDGGSRIFINKQDEVLNIETPFKLGNDTGQAYWRELNQ